MDNKKDKNTQDRRTKNIEIAGDNVEVTELTVGQIRQNRIESKVDDFEASLSMVKLSTGKDDRFVNKLTTSEIVKLIEFITNPETWSI